MLSEDNAARSKFINAAHSRFASFELEYGPGGTQFIMKKILTNALVAAALIGSAAQAQNTFPKGETMRGVTVSGVMAGDSTGTIGFAQFMDQDNSLRADVGLRWAKPDGGDASFGFSIDAGYRTYVATAGSVKAFTQPGIFLAKAASAADTADELTLAGTYSVGGEYFISPNFSTGAMAGVALTLANGFKDISFGTGTSALFATLYW